MEILIGLAIVAGIVIVVWVAGTIVKRKLPEQAGELVGQLLPVVLFGLAVVGLLVVFDRDQADLLIESSVRSIPRIMVALIVVIVARALGRIVGIFTETMLRRVSPALASRASLIISSLILGIGVIIAMQQLGVSTNIILVLVAAVAFGLALAAALAFGNGSELVARNVAAGRHVQNNYQAGQRVRVGDIEGQVTSIGLAATRLQTGPGAFVDLPNEEFLRSAVIVQT